MSATPGPGLSPKSTVFGVNVFSIPVGMRHNTWYRYCSAKASIRFTVRTHLDACRHVLSFEVLGASIEEIMKAAAAAGESVHVACICLLSVWFVLKVFVWSVSIRGLVPQAWPHTLGVLRQERIREVGGPLRLRETAGFGTMQVSLCLH